MSEGSNIRLGPALARMGLLGTLYFSQGLPFGYFTQALPVVLRKEGHSLGEIGLASLLTLPWALKFLWAPAVDRYWVARAGRRRSWILPLQLGAVVILVTLASANAPDSIPLMMGATLLLSLVAATQDIATDGLAVDVLATGERGWANGLQVAGYRVGMVVGGGALLILHHRLGSSTTYLAMAGLLVLATLPVALAREPGTAGPGAPGEVRGAATHFLRRPGAARLLLLLVAYKGGDAFATGMLRPFLTDMGLSLEDIGWLLGTVGFIAGLVGALAGGVLVNPLGRKQSLLLFGLLQAMAVAGYVFIAVGKPGQLALYAVCAVDHFAGGMATAALFTCMMDWCSGESRANATDYTVQASTVVIATGTASAVAGFSAQVFGYRGHFVIGAALTLGALVAVQYLFPAAGTARALPDRQGGAAPAS